MAARSVSFRHFILGLLATRPMSGYDIKRTLKNLTWLIGDPSFGSLYPALHALLKDNLVTVDVRPHQDKPPRKVYRITDSGKQALQEWADQSVASDLSLREFVMRLSIVGGLSFVSLIEHLEQRRAQVATHRVSLGKAVEALSEETGAGQRLVLNYGLTLATAELDWLDLTLKRLSQSSLPSEAVTGRRSI